MMLECPGVFGALVPDGWTATGRPGEFYQLEPPSRDAAAHISVYGREGKLRDHEARDLLAAFVSKAIGASGGQIRELNEGQKQQGAFAQRSHPGNDGHFDRMVRVLHRLAAQHACVLVQRQTRAPVAPGSGAHVRLDLAAWPWRLVPAVAAKVVACSRNGERCPSEKRKPRTHPGLRRTSTAGPSNPNRAGQAGGAVGAVAVRVFLT